MDRLIEVRVNGSHLTKDSKLAGIQHEANVKHLRITFDEGWDGFAKSVTWWDARGENPTKIILGTNMLEDIKLSTRVYLCPIPGEAMGEAGWCTFVIDGYRDGKRLRSVSDELEVKFSPFKENAGEPSDPTPSQAEQLQVQIDGIIDTIQDAVEAKEAAEKSEKNAKASEEAAATSERNAKASESNSAIYEDNAKAYSEGGFVIEKTDAGMEFFEVPGAKEYAERARVYVEGGTFPSGVNGAVTPVYVDGAANEAAKAKAYAEGGSFEEWVYNAPVIKEDGSISIITGWSKQIKTVDEGTKQYAEKAGEAAELAAISAAAALESENLAKRYADLINPEEFNTRLANKGDNLEFDNDEGLLYLTSGGERISDGIKVATSGGGGGGTGSDNNAVLKLQRTTDWSYKTISKGAACPISFTWSSLEDGMATGSGVLKITVNDTVKHTGQITQGEHIKDVSEYLNAGTNTVKVNVTDVYGNSRTLSFSITVVALILESSFDAKTAYTGAITYPYTPTGSAVKTVYFFLDGKEIGKETVNASGRQQTFSIPAQSHGAHSFEVYFTAEIDGDVVSSNHLRYNIICYEDGNTVPIIAVDWYSDTVEQFDTLTIPYIVYDPGSLKANVNLSSSESEAGSELTVDRTQQVWSYLVKNAGDLTLTLSCTGANGQTAVVVIELTATEASLDVEAETNDLALHLTSYGRSNNESDPSVWRYGDVEAKLTGFNYTSDGWVQDEDGITVLRVGGDARVEIPLQIFAKDFRTTGKTIEIEFASRSVLDYDAILATCWVGERGIKITAQQAMMRSEQSEVTTRYKEDDHLRLSFVVEKRNERRLILAYVNGIISGMMRYPENDNFAQGAPAGISLGSSDCTIDIYNIRVYDNDLTRFQMLDNWIADTQDLAEKKARYERNNIFDEYGQILPTTLRPHQCYLVLNCPVLPTFKGDKKTCSGKYVDPVNPKRSFTFTGAQIDVQGTSSQYYYVKNFKIKFNNGFVQNGQISPTYAMNDSAVPTNEFTFKADVASSEGANNVVLAELYNDLCPVKTPAQMADPRVRQTIEGHPIVVFHDDGSGAKFLGKYNFNNDKGTAEVFGFKPGDESWEIRENGNAQVSFKTDDFTNWETSFEARYPEKSKDITRLQQFVAWVASTNTEGLSIYERGPRLAKFKSELSNWVDVNDAIFYYLFTFIFLCIDQREKNAFPTYIADMAKWIWLFYDADSSLGTDNKGNLTFEYWMEDIDFTDAGEPVFNGQNNVFWSNLRECFTKEIKDEYKRLRTTIGADGKPLLSYERVDDLFAAHQSQWSEAIYNEDAWRKAVEPLEKAKDDQYLPMQQGKKEQHFKHWMYNRFRYLDSWAETGAALDDQNRIMMRAHAQGNITLTSYINMYGQVYFNDQPAVHRMRRDDPQEFEWTAIGAEDAVIGVNSAPMLTSLGDLSPLKLEYCHIQYAKHLTELKIGGDTENGNFVALTLGNNTLLRKLDVRNCPSLIQSVDARGCTNIEEIYFDGCSITGLQLPNGGILKKLHLPGTITNLTLINQTALTDFTLAGSGNITTLRVENAPSVVPVWDILNGMPAKKEEKSRVRLIGFDWEMSSSELTAFLNRMDAMSGLDEYDNNVDLPQLSGRIYVDQITQAVLDRAAKYVGLTVVYGEIVLFSARIVERTLSGDYTNDRVTKLSAYALNGNTGEIGLLSLPNVTDTVLTAISGRWCSASLSSMSGGVAIISLPKIATVFSRMFAYTTVSNLDLPSVTTVEAEGFYNILGLKQLRLPSVTSIGENNFQYTNTLIALILPGSTMCSLTGTLGWNQHNFNNGGTGYIYVPRSLVDTYKAATNWANYSEQFRALEDYTVDGTVTGELDESKI